MDRRHFLAFGAAGVASASCNRQPAAPVRRELFSFIHFSDVHIQQEKAQQRDSSPPSKR